MTSPTELQYEPAPKARPVAVERVGDTTRIVIMMHGLYAPVPRWVADLDMLALIVGPIWWFATLLIRGFRRLPKPPRAVFEVDAEHVSFSLRDTATGEESTFEWPRAAVVEARANRYGSGLWINVTGHVKDTFLSDLPQETTRRLEEALSTALSNDPPFHPCNSVVN